MSEENNTDVDVQADEDVETSDSDTTDETTETADAEDNSQDESDDGDSDTAEDSEEEVSVDEDEEPATRKPRTKAEHIARRQAKSKDRQARREDGEQGEDDEADGEDADREVVREMVNEEMAEFREERETTDIETDIDQFVADNPDFKPYATKAKKWAKNPTYRNVATKQLFHAIAGDDLMKIGAKRAKAAEEKARKTSTGKNASQQAGGKKPVWEMTDEEFEKEHNAVKMGG